MNDTTSDPMDDIAAVMEATIARELGVDVDAFNKLASERTPAMVDAIREAAATIDDVDVMKSFVASRIGADPTSREFTLHLMIVMTIINEVNRLDGVARSLGMTVGDFVVRTEADDQADAEAAHDAWANDDDPETHSAPDDA